MEATDSSETNCKYADQKAYIRSLVFFLAVCNFNKLAVGLHLSWRTKIMDTILPIFNDQTLCTVQTRGLMSILMIICLAWDVS